METVKLAVRLREETGDGPSRRLRAAGQVPGVIYGRGASFPIVVALNDLKDVLTHGHNVVLELDFGPATKLAKGETKSRNGTRYAVIKEIQRHPTRREILHVDLHEVDLAAEIEAEVAVELVGTPAGVKSGGVLDWEHREVTVKALPASVPDSLPLDVSGLEIGDHVTVGALVPPPGVTILDDPDTIIASVLAPRVEVEVAEAAAEAAEPEVIGGAKTED